MIIVNKDSQHCHNKSHFGWKVNNAFIVVQISQNGLNDIFIPVLCESVCVILGAQSV